MSMQSPIDITREALVPLAAGSRLEFCYPEAPVAAEVQFRAVEGDPIGDLPEVVPEVVVVPREGEAGVNLAGSAYHLRSFHWHTPSEHWLDGRPLPLELHLVHGREDGAFLVVGVLYRIGEPNAAIAPAFDLIDEFDPATLAPEAPQVAAARLSLAGLVPDARTTYRYPGSLTTAPFTEGVSWVVFTELAEAGADQVAGHDRLVSAATPACGGRPNPPGNARRLQPLGARSIATDLTVAQRR